MSHKQKPGESARKSGEYELLEPNGRSTREKVSMRKGESLPPTDKKGQRYSKERD